MQTATIVEETCCSSGNNTNSKSNKNTDTVGKEGNNNNNRALPADANIEEPVLIYHESARSIVFRDHLRRAVRRLNSRGEEEVKVQDHNEVLEDVLAPTPPTEELRCIIGGYQPNIVPLPPLELGPTDEFKELLDNYPPSSSSSHNNNVSSSAIDQEFTPAELEVCEMLRTQKCVVKTIKNVDWSDFLDRFHVPNRNRGKYPGEHDDIPPSADYHFNSFVTSTSLLPENGKKMRCFGSPNLYTTGVVFALPNEYDNDKEEEEAATRSKVWSWPAGYSAKTEFNIDGRGKLINGREEALTPLSVLRNYNDDYLNKDKYMVANREVEGWTLIPYNEVFLRVGGLGRLVQGTDCASGERCHRSFEHGVGLPVALFVRTATFGHLMSMLRTRARMIHLLGERHVKGIPLLCITPEDGIRVLTERLQQKLWKLAANKLTPFQNSTIAHKTISGHTDDKSFQQKVDELIDLDEDTQKLLTPKELARLAGGFGIADRIVCSVLEGAMLQDMRVKKSLCGSSTNLKTLRNVVEEGLTAAVRAGDYHASRQILLLYCMVSSKANEADDEDMNDKLLDAGVREEASGEGDRKIEVVRRQSSLSADRDSELMKEDQKLMKKKSDGSSSTKLPSPRPPPPLETDRLRSATNIDGVLEVLGAAQILKVLGDGSARKRAQEAADSVMEWVNYGKQSVAFRISSWYDQKAAQVDLKIATENDTNFMAFVSGRAIENRKKFADELINAIGGPEFNNLHFLHAVHEVLNRMHSPCLRLELLQYVFGLDNRYSLSHVIRSVELAANCLRICSQSI